MSDHDDPDALALPLTAVLRTAAACPTAPAVRDQQTTLSYGDLVARSCRVAARLQAAGVGSGDLVGISGQRSVNLPTAILGVWIAGAAYVPLDPAYPRARLRQMLTDAQVGVVLSDARSRSDLPLQDTTVLDLDHIVHEGPKPDHSGVGTTAAASDTAYIIFTSGSSGRPKGVRISHGALGNFLDGFAHALQISEHDTWAAVTSLSFDIAIAELVCPLLRGGTVAVLSHDDVRDGIRLAAAVNGAAPTVMQATPITWRLMLDAGWEGRAGLTAISGGETLPRSLAEQLLQRVDRLVNAYGPTEATVWATVAEVTNGDGPVPIGRALPGYRTFILDAKEALVGPGEDGHLHIGGRSLADGYLHRPEETARRFITHPQLGRVYATGDLARKRPDGQLEFLGRDDRQVKVQGVRIELTEIEEHLRALDQIRDAVATVDVDANGETQMTAYVVPTTSPPGATSSLRDALRRRLPAAMVPHHIVTLDELPLAPNRKIDHNRLQDSRRALHEAPPSGDPVEAYLQEVWAEVLGVSDVAVEEDFFDLGGDSIRAARITNRVETWLGEVVWPISLFDAPSIRRFAQYLRDIYPSALADRVAVEVDLSPSTTPPPLDDDALRTFRGLLPDSSAASVPASPRNPPAVFILNPPRSGSTLLRVMLAGHPSVFAPPEIELLTFQDMAERAKTFTGRESYRREGVLRAVMELLECSADHAREVVGEHEAAATTVQAFYRTLQSLAPGRLLVDKTPSNALDITALRRIEDYFEDALYIHLTRHPMGMIRSFVEARLDTVFFRRAPHEFTNLQLAELIWLASHQNTLEVLRDVPGHRQLRVRYEDLVRDPTRQVNRLCQLLHVAPTEAMLTPWENRSSKMADGLHPESKMMGDPKFGSYNSIDASAAERWRQDPPPVALSPATLRLASRLGYDDLEAGGSDTRTRLQL